MKHLGNLPNRELALVRIAKIKKNIPDLGKVAELELSFTLVEM